MQVSCLQISVIIMLVNARLCFLLKLEIHPLGRSSEGEIREQFFTAVIFSAHHLPIHLNTELLANL